MVFLCQILFPMVSLLIRIYSLSFRELDRFESRTNLIRLCNIREFVNLKVFIDKSDFQL